MTDATRCDAEIMLMDDRWGAFTDRCEGEQDHGSDHFTTMGATMPLGRLVWPSDCPHLVVCDGCGRCDVCGKTNAEPFGRER